jgi:exosortase/archaeosortase family protein
MSDSVSKLLEGRVYQRLIVVAAVAFIILPFITTFNEFLTKIVESLHFVAVIQGVAAPFIVRVVAVFLNALRIPASIDGSFLYLGGRWMPLRIYINWNCIGWQSFILFAFTLLTGLQGPYTRRSKLLTVLLGLEGTFLINVIRILVPTSLAYHSGYIPAIVFHDYMGTLLTLLWMGFFWNYAFGSVLVSGKDVKMGVGDSISAPDEGDKGRVGASGTGIEKGDP